MSRRSSRGQWVPTAMGGVLAGVILTLVTPVANAGLAVVKEAPSGILAVYQQNREYNIPNYITEDALLVSYAMIRQNALRETEDNVILPAFKQLITGLVQMLGQQPAGAATEANRDFVAVLAALLDGKADAVAAANAQRANDELKLILAAGGIEGSPLWSNVVDYSQFKPRGEYAGSATRENYFRAVRYANTVLFAVKDTRATGVSAETADRMTAQTLQLARAIDGSDELRRVYQRIDETFAWTLGAAQDLTLHDVLNVASENENASGSALRNALLAYAKTEQRQPRVLSAYVDQSRLEQGVTAQDALTGWRLFPGRVSPDIAAFQRLVSPEVGAYIRTCADCPLPATAAPGNGGQVKGFPRVDELMALLGSRLAAQRVSAETDDHYRGYAEAQRAARGELANATGMWREYLLLMRSWLTNQDEFAPDAARRLNSMRAFWTWQRHTDILYTQQSYTPVPKSLSLVPTRPRGAWLEPALALYDNMANLVEQHRHYTPAQEWDRFAQVLSELRRIAFKETQGVPLSQADEDYLNGLDTVLVRLTGGVDGAIVVDVHSNPGTNQVLEEGTRAAYVSHSAWPGSRANGGLFSVSEFRQPLNDRLTDEQWRNQVAPNWGALR